jgi:CheY-like chemotaxis protein
MRPGLPVLLYTGYREQITQADIERAGLAGVLRKPLEPSALLAALTAHVGQAEAAGRAS